MITSNICLKKFVNDYSFRLDVKTVDLYQKAVGQLLAYCDKPFDEIRTKDIRNWLTYLDKEEYKPVTVKTKLAGVKLFYKYCLEEKLITHNPVLFIPFPEVEETLPHYLETEQLLRLRKHVEKCMQERAMIEVLYATGIRIGELVAIKIEDIDWSERLIHIPNGKRKKARIVLFTRACEEHLRVYLEDRSDKLPFVFVNTTRTGPACIRTIQKKFKTYSKALDFPITPHTLRHTFAAQLAIKGMPLESIQVLLGHDSPHQTQLYARLYNHARKLKYDEWM